MAKKIGNQTPTKSIILPYNRSKGKECKALYNKTGNRLFKWQELQLEYLMAFGKGKLWVHSKYGIEVPRRNGKSEIANARCLWGLNAGEQILFTAHRTATSHSAWERIYDLLIKAGFKEKEDFTTLKQFGFETIKMLGTGGRINFRTRSSKGGLGEGYDLLIVDEAQEYTDDQESALKYIVSASKNPQTLLLGTPPTVSSSGTVFFKLREDVRSGKVPSCGWSEWSVEKQSDPNDRELWYQSNPSLGLILREQVIATEYTGDDIDFNIQRLGLWLKHNLKSAISALDWGQAQTGIVPIVGNRRFVGIKFGVDGINIAMSIAARTDDERIFIEGLDCRAVRDGYDWIINYLSQIKPEKIIIDGASGQQTLSATLREHKIKGHYLPTVADIIQANAMFEQGIYNCTICHMDQPAMTQAATNSEKRNIGSRGGFGYRAQKEGIEIALLDSAILAFWACEQQKEEPKPQKISY